MRWQKGKKKVTITINGNEREQVKQFRYLAGLRVITENGRCQQEIKTRIAMAKTVFNERRTLLGRKTTPDAEKETNMERSTLWRRVMVTEES